MKILHLDIETAPNLAHVWGLWQQNVGLNQIVIPGYVLCWAARWDKEEQDEMFFARLHHNKDGTPNQKARRALLRKMHRLMTEADAVVTYNGGRFDLPTLNAEFAEIGLSPPAPYAHVDLYRTVKRQFRFPSFKLAYVAQRFGVGSKVKHAGHSLWALCMKDDPESWRKMQEYNEGDVDLQRDLYRFLLPWVPNHPNHGLFNRDGRPCCVNCGGHRLKSKGLRTTHAQTYRRYQCRDCGAWSRDTTRLSPPIRRRPA